jgi:hypothetical protein
MDKKSVLSRKNIVLCREQRELMLHCVLFATPISVPFIIEHLDGYNHANAIEPQ